MTSKISHKSQQIITYLRQVDKPVSATTIARKLNTFPVTIYRSLTPLLESGIIERLPTYPATYRINNPHLALQKFLHTQTVWFQEQYGQALSAPITSPLAINFLQGRIALLESGIQDMHSLQQSLKVMVSGHEIPAEMMLGYQQTAQKGISIQIIIQQHDATNQQLINSWKNLGIKVKKLPSQQLRLALYDQNISYIMSYKNSAPANEELGVRFVYPPLNAFLSNLFDDKWKIAENL